MAGSDRALRPLGQVRESVLLRSDNRSVFARRDYINLVQSCGLRQEFITPRCPNQSGMVKRVIRTFKE
ncbi:TPA: DDE-type integrase/transposase/recombinase [Stenotrophomonas maltophilia]|nr:DDE-type integrase/transposase/recombinase [Stenotrophomonas maltophilia]